MIEVDVRDAVREVEKRLADLSDGVRNRASVMALNKTADKAKTKMRRAIISEFSVKSSDVSSRLQVIRARRQSADLVAILDPFASGRRGRALNVIHFLEKSVSMAEGRRRVASEGSGTILRDTKGRFVKGSGAAPQLRYKIKKHGGAKTIKGSFVGNKGRTIFQRTGDARTPIEPVQTIDVPQMFNSKRINQRVVERIQREFPVEFDRAARLVLNRFNR